MLRLGLGLGLGFTPHQVPAAPQTSNGGPELLLQAELVHRGDATSEGVLVRAVAVPWMEITAHLER
jgi:hypothetical protein